MRHSIGEKIFYSKFNKKLITITLIFAVFFFLWDLYKYYSFRHSDLKQIYGDIIVIGLVFALHRIVVKESIIFHSFLKKWYGLLISWILIIAAVTYGLDYPWNIILTAFLLSLLLLYFMTYYVKKKRTGKGK